MLLPDYFLKNIFDLTDDFIDANNIKGIIFDIDNTLVGFTQKMPDEKVKKFLCHLREKNICLAIASNNNKERVSNFAQNLDIPAYHRSMKPIPFKIKKIAKDMNLSPKNVALVGDQIYTDILGANLSGMISVLVDIIDTKETSFFKLKRALEKPVINKKRKKDLKNAN